MKRFPIMYSGTTLPHPSSISWETAELAYPKYAARFGTHQSLERLAERGGLSAHEMDQFLPDWRTREATIDQMMKDLKQCISIFAQQNFDIENGLIGEIAKRWGLN